jgi:hypothetical protein
MAFIHTETITVTISKMVKGSKEDYVEHAHATPSEVCDQLEAIVGELVGAGAVVEVTKE